MRFNVPQFIDIEDKIFGPFTFRQFIYLAGGGGLVYVAYKMLPFIFAILVGVPLAAAAAALAFIKINDKPLINTVEAAFNYFINDKLYIWKHETKTKGTKDQENKEQTSVSYLPKISESKLHDIAWGLDVLDKRS